MTEPAHHPDPITPAPTHVVATDISAQAAVVLEGGFRFLVLRQFLQAEEPAAFGIIAQGLMRSPLRTNRHGLSFAIAFRPEVVSWLSAQIGRPAQHDAEGRPFRNPRWPQTRWWHEERSWPDDIRTVDWCVEATFPDAACWRAFETRWRAALAGAAPD